LLISLSPLLHDSYNIAYDIDAAIADAAIDYAAIFIDDVMPLICCYYAAT